MRRVFSSNELSETALVRDALIHRGVAATIQNEYSGGTAIPEFRPPAEVWVSRDDDYENARRIVVETLSTLDSQSDAKPWACSNCEEENPQSFDMCWSCGQDRTGGLL
jgi:hypothetical protein